jgi:hypothetical protein
MSGFILMTAFKINHFLSSVNIVMFKSTINTKFLGMKIDKNLNWKNLIDQILPKWGAACWTVRLFHTLTHTHTHVLRMVWLHTSIP